MKKLVVFMMLLTPFLFNSCVTGSKLDRRTSSETQRLNIDQKRGADLCAPYELALAESNTEFAKLELAAGNHYRAEEHLSNIDIYAVTTALNADSCFPKDTDKDGVPDPKDRCPNEYGASEFEGCPDKDGDKIPDLDDKCPNIPGLKEYNGCVPEADRDKDGIPDSHDRCPDDPGLEEFKGCPDRDGDKVPDLDDNCPDVAGQIELKGCLPETDRDNDGVLDSQDRCPDDPGLEEFKGCPDRDGDKVPDVDDNCPDVAGQIELKGCLPETDRDNDGVLDSQDRCPDDPGLEEFKGCPDRDGDKIPDVDDKCPDVAGQIELQGCLPETDRDNDGVLDSQDRCPDDSGSAELRGCPDRDGDKIPDLDDKCPDAAGIPELNGCPKILDKDGDGINDDVDKCPEVPGIAEENGCPKKYKLIVVTAQKIELKQVVLFKSGKALIDSKSYTMLQEVADAIKNAPSIKKVKIEGHSDNVGNRNFNIALSQKRAESVRDFLIEQGVDGRKLEAIGYGPDRPVASNRTKAGKAKNRRVEFILEQ